MTLCCEEGFVIWTKYDKDFDTATPLPRKFNVLLLFWEVEVDVVGVKGVIVKFES